MYPKSRTAHHFCWPFPCPSDWSRQRSRGHARRSVDAFEGIVSCQVMCRRGRIVGYPLVSRKQQEGIAVPTLAPIEKRSTRKQKSCTAASHGAKTIDQPTSALAGGLSLFEAPTVELSKVATGAPCAPRRNDSSARTGFPAGSDSAKCPDGSQGSASTQQLGPVGKNSNVSAMKTCVRS